MVVWNPPWVKSTQTVQPPPPPAQPQPVAPAQTEILTKWQNNELPPSLLQAAQVPSYDDWKFQTYTPEPGWGVKAQGYVPRQTAQPQLTSSLPTELLSKFQRPWEHPAEAITGGLEAYQKGVVKPIAAYATLPPAEYGKLPEPSEVVKSYEERKMPWGTKGAAELLLDPVMWVGGGGTKGEKLIQQAAKFADEQLAKKGVGAIEDIIRGISKSIPELHARKIVEEAAERAGLMKWIPGKKAAQKIPEVAPKVVPKTGMPPEVESGMVKLRSTLDNAKKLITETKGLRHEELTARVARAKAKSDTVADITQRHRVFWAEMRGTMPEADWSAMQQAEISGEEIVAMFKHIDDAGFQPLTTNRARSALDKAFGGEKLQDNEVKLLEKIFGEGTFTEFSQTQKYFGLFSDFINLPKASESALDISGGGRQGLGLITAYPIEGVPTFPNMIKYFFSEKASKLANVAIWDNIKSSKYSDMLMSAYERGKFYIAPWGEDVMKGVSKRITNREETFFSRWASKIWHIKMSERSFVLGLNKLRSDILIKNILPKWEKSGIKITQQVVDDIAEMITLSSGRGNLGPINKYANWVNGILFSGRFQASRVQTPVHWGRLLLEAATKRTPESIAVAKESTRIAMSWVAANLTILATLYYGLRAAGENVSVEKDPRSTDYGQLKIGNTRIDIWAGARPYVVLLARLISGETKAATTGKVSKADPFTIIGRFARTKLAPMLSTFLDIKTGKTVTGEEVGKEDILKHIGEMYVPLPLEQVGEAAEAEGLLRGTLLSIPEFLGAGVQTYEEEPPPPSKQKVIPFKAPHR